MRETIKVLVIMLVSISACELNYVSQPAFDMNEEYLLVMLQDLGGFSQSRVLGVGTKVKGVPKDAIHLELINGSIKPDQTVSVDSLSERCVMTLIEHTSNIEQFEVVIVTISTQVEDGRKKTKESIKKVYCLKGHGTYSRCY